MATDPAWLFYVNDFDSETKFFSDEQVGIYLRLLIAEHQHGRLSEKQVLFICKTYDEDIMLKFKRDGNGLYYNERLEEAIIKRKQYSLSRSINKKGIKSIISKTYDNHMSSHMENENENETISSLKGVRGETFLWGDVVKQFINDFKWKEKFVRDKNISLRELELKMNEFINDLELKEDYKNLKELKNHFTNYFNKNKENANTKSITNTKTVGTSAARIAALKQW